MPVDTDTRESIGHSDHTKEQVFGGAVTEPLKIRVVNETIMKQTPEGIVLDSTQYGGLDGSTGLDGEVWNTELWLQRRWSWTSADDLKVSPTNTGTIGGGSTQIDLDIDT